MAFLDTVRMPDGTLVDLFLDPTPREWRELEAGIDPVDGVRAAVVGEHLVAWTPPVLHEELREELARLLPGARDGGIPVRVAPALGMVTVTTSLPAGEAVRRRRELVLAVRRVPALRRRLGPQLKVMVTTALEHAA